MRTLTNNERIVKDILLKNGFTKSATAAIMGVVGGESGFKTFKESSYNNTSNSRIRKIFSKKLGSKSDSFINSLKASDYDFFNFVYGGVYGNAQNEGFKYVGRGFNGLTFKDNYKALANYTGIDFIKNPELLERPKYAALGLVYYFRNEKNLTNLDQAFKEAYRRNAGYGNSWNFYSSSANPVHKQGTVLKRKKAVEYYSLISDNNTFYFALGAFAIALGGYIYLKNKK